MTEKNIESLLHEDRSFEPPVEFASAARLGNREDYDAIRSKAAADPEAFWASIAEELHWFRKWDEVLDWSNPPFAKWFVGAKTNISHNCLDRNLDRGLGDGCAFDRVVDVRPQVLDDISSLQQVDEDRLGDSTVVGGIGQVFAGEASDGGEMGEQIGLITSSTIAPMLGAAPVAFGMLRSAHAGEGSPVRVVADGAPAPATVSPLRFLQSRSADA